jgi:bisphosphoglycerate-dependent phosphoglycerate mutase
MIDIFEQIKKFLIFESEDDFYYLQILQRKKENPNIGANSRVIKNYYINSIDYLEKRYDEIKMLCNIFNARAMLRLNKRSYSKVAFKTLQNIANSMSNKEYSCIRKSYDRACGNGHNDKNKTWIVDIDNILDNAYISDVIEFINNLNDYNENNVISVLPTKNGVHVITKPFNINEFKKEYQDIDIHKDNPINLYIP